MSRPRRLAEAEIRDGLSSQNGWELRDDRIRKTFEFADFIQAWGFMSRAALVAQALDHHPDWSNVYRTVVVELTTHDAGGVSELDLKLAREMDRLADS